MILIEWIFVKDGELVAFVSTSFSSMKTTG